MKLSVILPTYNEKKNLEILIGSLKTILERIEHEIIIVDDNSPDKTGELADELAAGFNRIKVIHRKQKKGLTSAIATGIVNSEGDIICVMDSDLSHPPEKVFDLIKPILDEKADFVIGSRLIKGGSVEEWPMHRKMISLIARMLALPLTKVHDTMSGFFALRRGVLNFVKIKSRGYKICLEILVKGKYNNVKEIPYVFRNRTVGKSKLDFGEYINYLSDLVGLYLYKMGFR